MIHSRPARGCSATTCPSWTTRTVAAQPRTSTANPQSANGTLEVRPSKLTVQSRCTTRVTATSKTSGSNGSGRSSRCSPGQLSWTVSPVVGQVRRSSHRANCSSLSPCKAARLGYGPCTAAVAGPPRPCSRPCPCPPGIGQAGVDVDVEADAAGVAAVRRVDPSPRSGPSTTPVLRLSMRITSGMPPRRRNASFWTWCQASWSIRPDQTTTSLRLYDRTTTKA
jgi:hypothetical protein